MLAQDDQRFTLLTLECSVTQPLSRVKLRYVVVLGVLRILRQAEVVLIAWKDRWIRPSQITALQLQLSRLSGKTQSVIKGHASNGPCRYYRPEPHSSV